MSKLNCYLLELEGKDDGICILGTKRPTPKEATKYLQNYNLDKMFDSSSVVNVMPLTEDAIYHLGFGEAHFPIFGEDLSVGISLKALYDEGVHDFGAWVNDGKQLEKYTIVHSPVDEQDMDEQDREYFEFAHVMDANDHEYYDLCDKNGVIVCMDGESCQVTHIEDENITLFNDGEKFIMPKDVFETASMLSTEDLNKIYKFFETPGYSKETIERE